MLSIPEADDAEDIFPRLYQPPTDDDSLAAVALAECPSLPFPAMGLPPDTNARGRTSGTGDAVAYLVLLNTHADDLAIGLFFDHNAAHAFAVAAYQDPHTYAKKSAQKSASTCFLGVQVVEFAGTEPNYVTNITNHDLIESPLADPA